MKFSFRASAARDAIEARAWYGETDPGGEGPFSSALARAFSLIGEFPHAGAPTRRRYRSVAVRGYPYRVVYAVGRSQVRIVAIAHTSRKPGYWQERS